MLILQKNISSVADRVPESIKLQLHRSIFDSLLKLEEPTDHLSMLLTAVVNYYDNENGCLVFGKEIYSLNW